MSVKVFFLKDSEINDWLISGFAQRDFSLTFLGINNSSQMLSTSRLLRIIVLHIRYLNLSLRAIFQSKKDDIIVCFLDIIGLYVFLLSKLLFKRISIIPINIMFNDRNEFISKMKRCLFRTMLKDSAVYPTVNSEGLSFLYKNLFKIPDKHFFILHDCYGKLKKYEKPFSEGNDTIFCGGTNGRDWKTLGQTARLLPDLKFVIAGPAKNTLGNNMPPNIEYYFNIPFSEFQRLIKECSVLALPIDTEAPAGLIVLFSAGLMSKPVIATDNVTMREYITSGENGFLIKRGDHINFSKQIDYLISDKQKQKEFGEKLFLKVEELGSPSAFVDKVIDIVQQVQLCRQL
jgi:glycosyltransferase involved in cell wall biosynthesis